jgi:hypothetical protein
MQEKENTKQVLKNMREEKIQKEEKRLSILKSAKNII